MTKKEYMVKQASEFVHNRFPLANCIQYSYGSWIVVERELRRYPSEYGMIVNYKDLHWLFVGRRRCSTATGWNSAMLEIMKFEAGKKDEPLMQEAKS